MSWKLKRLYLMLMVSGVTRLIAFLRFGKFQLFVQRQDILLHCSFLLFILQP
jgi:hypothetical protein